MNQLRKANFEALEQIERMICELPAVTECNSFYADSGIGRHIRHILDHYRNLKDGLASGTLDYNNRQRGSLVEQNAGHALAAIAEYKQWILNFDVVEACSIYVLSEISSLETSSVSLESTVARELHYIAYHCIHHAAYCALLIQQQGYEVNPAIGLAPATATYQRSLHA